MKLLLCDTCLDVFKLTRDIRACECGLVRGRYDDNGHTAVTNGEGRALAIGNGSLLQALAGRGQEKIKGYEDYNTFLAWVREHDGPSNPRSRIDPDL